MDKHTSWAGRFALLALLFTLLFTSGFGCTTVAPVLDHPDGSQDVDGGRDGGRVLTDSGAHPCDVGPVAFPCFTEVVAGGGCCDESVDFLCSAGGGYECPAGSIRGDACTGRRDMGTCGGSDAGVPPGDAGRERVSCGGVIVCLAEAPVCPAGQTPQNIAGCYGPCVPIEVCDCEGVLNECPGGSCGSDGHCRLDDGEECSPDASGCGMGSSCCYPCGIPGCEFTCEPSCEAGSPGCEDGCLLRP